MNQSIINQAPALVAFGLRTGLLSIKPQPTAPADPREKYREANREVSRQGMRRLRMERAHESKVSVIES
jgi:hypothetical protein